MHEDVEEDDERPGQSAEYSTPRVCEAKSIFYDDVLTKVLEHVHPLCLLPCACLNRSLHRIVSSIKQTVTYLDVGSFLCSNNDLPCEWGRARLTWQLGQTNNMISDRSLGLILSHFPHVKHLSLRQCLLVQDPDPQQTERAGGGFFDMLVDKMPTSLASLDISFCHLLQGSRFGLRLPANLRHLTARYLECDSFKDLMHASRYLSLASFDIYGSRSKQSMYTYDNALLDAICTKGDLRVLHVGNSKVFQHVDAHLLQVTLTSLKHVVSLDLSWIVEKTRGDYLIHLIAKNLTILEGLALAGLTVSDESLLLLSRECSRINRLQLVSCEGVSSKALSELMSMEKLLSFNLVQPSSSLANVSVRSIAGQQATLTLINVCLEDLRFPIVDQVQTSRLTIVGTVGERNQELLAAFLSRFLSLKELYLELQGISADDIATILATLSLPNLSTLALGEMGEEGMTALAHLQPLESLKFRMTSRNCDRSVVESMAIIYNLNMRGVQGSDSSPDTLLNLLPPATRKVYWEKALGRSQQDEEQTLLERCGKMLARHQDTLKVLGIDDCVTVACTAIVARLLDGGLPRLNVLVLDNASAMCRNKIAEARDFARRSFILHWRDADFTSPYDSQEITTAFGYPLVSPKFCE